MSEPFLLLIAASFLLAGSIKGALGLGLPTVAMGLLAVAMPPAPALAIVTVPAIVTNIWQTFGGPYLRDIMQRLAPKPVAGFTFKLRVVDAPIVNAFALPGGQIVVYTGLRARSTGRSLGISLPLVGLGLVAFSVSDSGFVYLTTAGLYSSGSPNDLISSFRVEGGNC